MKNLFAILIMLCFPLLFNAQEPAGNWERIWEMKPGYFRVMQNGMMGVVNAEGVILVPCQFNQVYDLTDDNYVKVLKDRKIGLYQLDWGMILPAEYDQIWAFEGKTAKVLKEGKYGFVDRGGHIVIPVEYNHIWNEENGLIKVLKDGKTGFLDKDGNVILPTEYQQIWSFEGNLAKVQKDGKFGYVDTDGRVVIPTIYDQIGNFQYERARAVIGDNILYIDYDGNVHEVTSGNEKVVWQLTNPEPHKIENSNADDANNKKVQVVTNSKKTKPKYFYSHLASFNAGINGYVNSNFKDILPEDYKFMDLNPEKSCEFSLYPFQQSTRLIGSYVGLVTAIGAQYNNYRFNLYNSDELTENAKLWFYHLNENVEITKAKLTIFTLNVPLMLEIQLPDGKGRKGIYLSGGVIGSMKINSYTRVDYYFRDFSYKRRMYNISGLQMFKYSFMARAGYDWLGIYATYSPMPMFKKDKGPELYQYSVGVSINF